MLEFVCVFQNYDIVYFLKKIIKSFKGVLGDSWKELEDVDLVHRLRKFLQDGKVYFHP